MPKLRESRRPATGQQHTYSLDPPTEPGCTVSWEINGQPVRLGDKVGGLEVKGFGAPGTMTVEVIEPENVWFETVVTAKIRCPERPITTVGPMLIGSVYWDPCEQEPCASARRRYGDLSIMAPTLADTLIAFCQAAWREMMFFGPAFGLFVIALLTLLFCRTLHLDAVICQFLYAALALCALIAAWRLYRLLVQLRIHRDQLQACRKAQSDLQQAYREMLAACPPECRLPEVQPRECRCR